MPKKHFQSKDLKPILELLSNVKKERTVSLGKYSSKEIRKILSKQGPKNAIQLVVDSYYFKYSLKKLEKVIKKDLTDKIKYRSDLFDCDDSSFLLYIMMKIALPGCTIGIVFVSTPSGGHALNFFIDEKGKFWYIEPQSDLVFSDKKDYTIFFKLV